MALGSTMIRWLAGVRHNDDMRSGCALGMVEMATPNAADMFHRAKVELENLRMPCDCNCNVQIMGSACVNTFYSPVGEEFCQIVVHLFNYHVMTAKDWSMERLIDWVRSVELADPEEDSNAATEAPAHEGTAVPDLAVPVLR